MVNPSFAVNLGSSIYLDSEGRLLPGMPANVPVYKPADGFNFDVTPLKDALKGFGGVLPDLGDDKSVKRFTDMGLKPDTIQALGKIADICGIAAGIVAGAGVALVLLKMLGTLQAGEDPVSQLIKKEFDDLDRRMANIEKKWDTRLALTWRSNMEARLILLNSYVQEIMHASPDPVHLEGLLADIRHRLGDAFIDLNIMTEAAIWETTYPADLYHEESVYLGPLLCFILPNGALIPASPHADGALRYDHRLPVPLTLFAVTTFLTMIRVATPEFRSTGIYAEQLKSIARNLDGQIRRMRTESLSVLHYDVDSVRDTQLCTTGMITAFRRAQPPYGDLMFAVGAMDLCHHSDSFFAEQSAATTPPWTFTRVATIDFAFKPPHIHVGGLTQPPTAPTNSWSILNPVECAAALNTQSRTDYGQLLVASGCTALIVQATLLRHLATEPDQSETVSGLLLPERRFRSETETTASSGEILLHALITSPAVEKRYQYKANATLSTQPLGRSDRLRYRILLRTINSLSAYGTWREPEYDPTVWSADYRPDPTDQAFKKLSTTFNPRNVVGELELATGFSPVEAMNLQGRATLTAHTFDWYIPIPTPFTNVSSSARQTLLAAAYSAGWRGPAARLDHTQQPRPAAPESSSVRSVPFGLPGFTPPLPDDLFTLDTSTEGVISEQTWLGERRHVRPEMVAIDWELRWHGDHLQINLTSEPTNRSHQIHLVVEEQLWSGESLHSVFVADVANRLTFIPQEFFTRERNAIQEASKALHDFQQHYSISDHPGPVPPVIDQIVAAQGATAHVPSEEAAAAILVIAAEAQTLGATFT